MPTFTGNLYINEIFNSLYNMIIGQIVFSDNISSPFMSLVDRSRVEGSMFGDTMLYYATNALNAYDFNPDTEEQTNVLKTHRPPDPNVQAITIDTFKWIPVTIDDYFSKRAFTTASAFADFNGVVLEWLRDTKRIYDATTYNTFIGTDESDIGSQTQTVTLGDNDQINAERIAEKVANILVEMKDVGTDYNDLGFYRAYDPADLIVVWNSEYVNNIKKVGLPAIFHKDGLMDKFDENNVLPARYFGRVNETDGTATAATRWLKSSNSSGAPTIFAGSEFGTGTYSGGETYEQDGTIICKIMHKKSVPYMSGFETESEFWNSLNLSRNHYLIFGHNDLEHLSNYPMVTLRAVKA